MHTKNKFSIIDIFVIAGILLACIYFSYRISVGLNYNWNWAAIPQFLFRYDNYRDTWVPNLLMQGLFTTIRLSIWGILLATLLGIIMGFCRTSNSLFKRLLGGTYVELIRNTPPLVLIFIFYYFFSSQIIPATGLENLIQSSGGNSSKIISFLFSPISNLPTFLSAVLTLGIFEGAYITEIIRSGIQSIDKGQWEASHTLGFTRYQQFRHIIFPQAIRKILPPLAGQFISTIKDSAIVSVISVQELTFQGMEIMASTYLTFEIWITVAVMYLMLSLIFSLLSNRLELYFQKSMA